jgi:hypothetical protein
MYRAASLHENARSLYSRQGRSDGIEQPRRRQDNHRDARSRKGHDNQGFIPESYALVIASRVLHATAKLKATIENAWQLLEQGAYPAILKVTDLEQARLGLILGSLPGWQLVVSSGRTLPLSTDGGLMQS